MGTGKHLFGSVQNHTKTHLHVMLEDGSFLVLASYKERHFNLDAKVRIILTCEGTYIVSPLLCEACKRDIEEHSLLITENRIGIKQFCSYDCRPKMHTSQKSSLSRLLLRYKRPYDKLGVSCEVFLKLLSGRKKLTHEQYEKTKQLLERPQK